MRDRQTLEKTDCKIQLTSVHSLCDPATMLSTMTNVTNFPKMCLSAQFEVCILECQLQNINSGEMELGE